MLNTRTFLKLFLLKKIALAAVVLAMAAMGCTKPRPAVWPDDKAQSVFSKDELLSARMTVTTGAGASQSSGDEALTAFAEQDRLPLVSVEGSSRLKPLFDDLRIEGRPNTRYEVVFGLDNLFVTAYKVLPEQESGALSIRERAISVSKVRNDSGTSLLVPLFKVEVQDKGVAVRAKNDLGEDTRTLRLSPSDWESATHLVISLLPSKRKDVDFNRNDSDVIFLRDRLDGRIFTKAEFIQKTHEYAPVPDNAKVFTTVNGARLNLFQITNSDSLDEVKRKTLGTREDVARCGDQQKAAVSESIPAEKCVAVLISYWDVNYVEPKLVPAATSGKGPRTSEYEFNAVRAGEGSLIRLAKWQQPHDVQTPGSVDDLAQFDPSRILSVGSVSGEEYLFLTTLVDMPNNYRGPLSIGETLPLEIVRFVFEPRSVRIVRSQPLLRKRYVDDLDSETLVTIPAEYYRKVEIDEDGFKLQKPKMEKVDPNAPGAIALLDWGQNQFADRASVISYSTRCLSADRKDARILDVESKTGDAGKLEKLGFSLNSTYEGNGGCLRTDEVRGETPSAETFTFQERVSLKKYVKGSEEIPSIRVPFQSQKDLGFGLFTYKKKTLNKYDRGDTVDTDVALPSIFDIQAGKKLTFILTGLPDSGEERERAISGARKVVSMWNQTLRLALKDSPLERSEDVVELKIEGGNGVGKIRAGDLDANYIVYVQKATDTGPYGLASAAHNPRTGKVESATVYLFGGNIYSSIGDFRRLYTLRENIRPSEPAIPVTPPAGAGSGSSHSIEEPVLLPVTSAELVNENLMAATSDLLSRSSSRSALKDVASSWAQMVGVPAEENAKDSAQGDAMDLFSAMDSKTGMLKRREMAPEAEIMNGCRLNMPAPNVTAQGLAFPVYGGKKFEQLSDTEIFGIYFDFALSHEMGHLFGLRHNFVGSYDKANWKADSADSSNRGYSSVMDYPTLETLATFDGMGPYDVAAIRAAYTGTVELASATLAKLGVTPGKTVTSSGRTADGNVYQFPVYGGRFVKLEDYLRVFLGKTSWTDVTPLMISRAPIKQYQFCTDDDVGVSPVCNRYDYGTTPVEIVKNLIYTYKALYVFRNFAHDRITFDSRSRQLYVNSIADIFLNIRLFLDETFYLIAMGQPVEAFAPYRDAAIEGYYFFHEVIHSPDAPATYGISDLQREAERPDGSKYYFSTHIPKTVYSDPGADRLAIIGYDIDKALAIQMLTAPGFRQPKHMRGLGEALRISYVDLEKAILADKPIAQLPTIKLLTDVMKDELSAFVQDDSGKPIRLDSFYRASSTDLMRGFAVMAATDWIDRVSVSVDAPVSSTFRIRSGAKPSQSVPSVTSDGTLYYYPLMAGDSVADQLVRQAALLAKIRTQGKEFVSKFIETYYPASVQAPAATPGPAPSVASNSVPNPVPSDVPNPASNGPAAVTAEAPLTPAELALDAELARLLPENYGGTRKSREFKEGVDGLLQEARSLQEMGSKLDPKIMSVKTEALQARLERAMKGEPVFGAVVLGLSGEKLGVPLLDKIKPRGALLAQENSIVASIASASAIFELLHPEYFRQ